MDSKQKLMLAIGAAVLLIAIVLLTLEVRSTNQSPTSPLATAAGIDQEIKKTEASSLSPQAKQMKLMMLHRMQDGIGKKGGPNGAADVPPGTGQ